jgi:hypothetical protein
VILNLKYQLNYGNISGDNFKCDIYKVGTYSGDPIVLDGYCVHSYKSVNNIFDPIRGASLNINFLADASGILEDLNVIQEFQFFVVFFRNEKPIFSGWVLPDGIFQDYVKDEWNVSLQAVDGLGFLKNYEYIPQVIATLPSSSPTVENVYPQEFNILYTILSRVGYNIPIATFDDINQGFDSTTGEPFGSIDFANINSRIVNKEVFINKNENYFDCETILKDILQKYNFTISQGLVNDELCWILARPAFQLNASNQKGSIWKPASVDGNKIIFSRAETFANNNNIVCSDYQSNTVTHNAIHCGANQNIIYNPAVQNFRFDQKWLGLRNQYFSELTDEFFNQLVFSNPIDQFVASGMQIASAAPGGGSVAVFVQDEFIDLPIDYEDLTFKFDISVTGVFTSDYPAVFNFTISGQRLNDSGGTTQYVLIYNSENQLTWVPFGGPSVLGLETNLSGTLINKQVLLEVKPPFLQNLTNFKITFRRGFFNATAVQVVNKVGVFWSKLPLGIGEFHDSKLVNFRSSFLNEPVKVINSNQNDDVFLNNLYRNDAGNLIPQSSWNTKDSAPIYDDLLELTSRERLDMLQKPQMIFSGDIYGFIPYFTTVKYDRIDGLFLPLSYSYNTLTNIIKLECSQGFSSIVNKTYEQRYYFEDEKNVLIKEI